MVNFVKGACKIHDVNYDRILENWKLGCWNMEEVLGVDAAYFYGKLEEDPDYWVNLEDYDYAKNMWNRLSQLAPTYVCSTPTYDPNSGRGKMIWMQKFFDKGFRDYILTPRKYMCAAPNHILIDDHEDNIKQFNEAGGIGILFPQFTNHRHKEARVGYQVVIDEVIDLIKNKD